MPLITIPLGLFLVHRHPQPVDDCPCFEDAIAFMSVLMGEATMRWLMYRYGFDENFFVGAMPGAAWASWADVMAWWAVAGVKMVMGE